MRTREGHLQQRGCDAAVADVVARADGAALQECLWGDGGTRCVCVCAGLFQVGRAPSGSPVSSSNENASGYSSASPRT
jgi:hypothetical protein